MMVCNYLEPTLHCYRLSQPCHLTFFNLHFPSLPSLAINLCAPFLNFLTNYNVTLLVA